MSIHGNDSQHHFEIVGLYQLFMSSSESPRRSPQPQQRTKPHKVFVTNLDIEVATAKLEEELRQKFSKYGKLDSVVAKKSYNNQYSFAFIEYKEGQDATTAVNELNNTSLFGKKMKVQLQDNSRRRKGGNQTCYHCGKPGHYARNCRQNKEREENGRSRSGERNHKKSKKKRHHRSESSDSSSDHKKKQKKHSKKVKKHSSKHKKDRRRSDSDSSA